MNYTFVGGSRDGQEATDNESSPNSKAMEFWWPLSVNSSKIEVYKIDHANKKYVFEEIK